MGGSKESFNKKEVRNKKEKARKEKEKKRQARRENASKSFEDMIAYVDQNGNIVSEAPDQTKKESVKLEDIEIGIPKSAPDSGSSKIRTGQVSFFNDNKGFGFIIDSETNERIFVHANELSEPVKEGNRVNFEVEKGVRGPSAVNVVIDKK